MPTSQVKYFQVMQLFCCKSNFTFGDTDNNPDYTINLNSGILKIIDSTNTADRIVVNSTGVSIPNDLDVDGHAT